MLPNKDKNLDGIPMAFNYQILLCFHFAISINRVTMAN